MLKTSKAIYIYRWNSILNLWYLSDEVGSELVAEVWQEVEFILIVESRHHDGSIKMCHD